MRLLKIRAIGELKDGDFKKLSKVEGLVALSSYNPNIVKYLWGKFTCQKCGYCCRNVTAGIWLQLDEHRWIKSKLGNKKTKEVTTLRGGKWYLNHPCIFHIENKCSIYEDRPVMCHAYPLSIREGTVYLWMYCPASLELIKAIDNDVKLNGKGVLE